MNYRYLSFGSASLAVVFAAFLLNNKSNERPLAFVQDSKVNIITQSVDKIPKKSNTIKQSPEYVFDNDNSADATHSEYEYDYDLIKQTKSDLKKKTQPLV
jgi:hypothetical protein